MPVSSRLAIATIAAGYLMRYIAVGESISCAEKPRRQFVVRSTADVSRLAHEAAKDEGGDGANLHAVWVGGISVQYTIKVRAASTTVKDTPQPCFSSVCFMIHTHFPATVCFVVFEPISCAACSHE